MKQPLGEFDLIQRFFQRPAHRSPLGVGDDCALLAPRPGMQLAVSSDMLVQGRHFLPDVAPRLLGHKALAVNLSDLAACGAQPLAFTLALALPHSDEAWCQAFSEGLFALAEAHDCELIGGDTTQGPLTICITVFGEVPSGQAILRSGAQVGDDIWVSGTLGDARLALDALQRQHMLPPPVLAQARQRLEAPTPRVALGQALRGIASSALDVSDGLLGDLNHILHASHVGASIEVPPPAPCWPPATTPCCGPWPVAALMPAPWPGEMTTSCALPPPHAQRSAVEAASQASATPVTRIGTIEALPGIRIFGPQGERLQQRWPGFDHFA